MSESTKVTKKRVSFDSADPAPRGRRDSDAGRKTSLIKMLGGGFSGSSPGGFSPLHEVSEELGEEEQAHRKLVRAVTYVQRGASLTRSCVPLPPQAAHPR